MALTKFLIGSIIILFFAFPISAQKINFPNELKGFQFYKRGKLKNVELLTTTRQQIRDIFGDDCFFDGCSYDEDWDLGFMYYWEGFQTYKYENGVKKNYVVSPEYVDRVCRILLKPRKTISLKEFTFPKKFKADFGIGEHSIKRKFFTDSNGLYYSVNGSVDGTDNGNLTNIQYGIPENLREEGFILVWIEDEPSSNL